jgi:lipoate-protein ligase A
MQVRGAIRLCIAPAGVRKSAPMALFRELRLWLDPSARPGPEAMAVDEWLLETAPLPTLRVYRWQGEWGSVGYFGKLADAMAAFPGLAWVRRWTGGGTVDHRADWTYTLAVPAECEVARLRGAESYRVIHAALALTLADEGIEARLSHGEATTGATACFENPVNHDLVGHAARKLAGAGQRRTKAGLLHQGSVAAACDDSLSKTRAQRLATALAAKVQIIALEPPASAIAEKLLTRYARPEWLERC